MPARSRKRLEWSARAGRDLFDAWLYIAADSVPAAETVARRIIDAAEQLPTYPKLGRPGKIPGTRELIPHENYRLVYEIDGETVWVLTLAHTARQWPPARE